MLWSEKKTRPITTALKDAIRSIKKSPDGESDIAKGAIALIEKQIAAREADAKFSITLRHIGSLDEPFLLRGMQAELNAAEHAANVRARKELGALAYLRDAIQAAENKAATLEGDLRVAMMAAIEQAANALQVNEDNVAAFKSRDPEWAKSLNRIARDWFTHGVVDGEKEYARIFDVGGPDLVFHAFREIQAFQEVSPELGES